VTLDVSALYHAAGAFTVIGAAGDNALGGEDVDDCVAGLLADDVEARGGVVVDDGGRALGAGRRGAGGDGNVCSTVHPRQIRAHRPKTKNCLARSLTAPAR